MVYDIATKFGITICPYTILLCTKFQNNQITHLCLIATFVVWQKEENQRKVHICCNSVKFQNVRWWHWLTFPLQILSCFAKMRSYMYAKNRIIVLPVNNLQVWGASFLGRMTHYYECTLHSIAVTFFQLLTFPLIGWFGSWRQSYLWSYDIISIHWPPWLSWQHFISAGLSSIPIVTNTRRLFPLQENWYM